MFVSTLANLRLVNATVAAVEPNAFLLSRTGTLNDGAAGAFFWNPADTRSDDDGCIICPTGYVGSGRWNRIITDFISLNWYATYGTSAGDTSPSLRAAIAAAQTFNVRRITFSGELWFATQICNATYGWTLPSGLTFEGAGRMPGGTDGDGVCTWIWNGAANTYMFDVRNPDGDGVGPSCRETFKNFNVESLNGGWISVNALRQNGATYTCGVGTFPAFVQGWRFENIEASANFAGCFLLGKEMFETFIDQSCLVENFFHGIDLTGCDDGLIQGRYDGNASRHISIQKEGTFGNSSFVQPNYLGPTQTGYTSEYHYGVYDTGESTMLMTLYMEASSDLRAMIFLGGAATTVMRPKMYGISGAPPYFELGANGVDIKMFSPECPSVSAIGYPIVGNPTYFVYSGGGYDDYCITIFDPSTNVAARIQDTPRVRIINGNTKLFQTGQWALSAVGLGPNGPKIIRMQIHAGNPGPMVGIGNPPSAITQDTSAGNIFGTAFYLDSASGSGFKISYVAGRDINNGDTLQARLLARLDAAPSSGNISMFFTKNGASPGGAVTTNSTAFTMLSVSETLSGFSAGDTIDINVINNGLAGAHALIGCLELINNT